MRRWVIPAVLFFLGFPIFGLVVFWMDGHRKLESSAIGLAQPKLEAVLSSWDADVAEREGTSYFRAAWDAAALAAAEEAWGRFERMEGPLVTTTSFAHSRDTIVWHFVELEGRAVFAKGQGPVRVRVARRSSETVDEVRRTAERSQDDRFTGADLDKTWRLDAMVIGTGSLPPAVQ